MDATLGSEVRSGKHAVDDIMFWDNDLKTNGIEKIENIELYFHIFNLDTWDTIKDTDIVKLSF